MHQVSHFASPLFAPPARNAGSSAPELANRTQEPLTVRKWQKKPAKLIPLLQALAFEVGNEVSFGELGRTTGLDNGVRNALLAQFGPIELRPDKGALWENYLMAERRKYLAYQRMWVNSWFWRTQDQQEIDYVEEQDGSFLAREFKWNPAAKARLSKTFENAYPNTVFKVITPLNVEDFLMKN